MALRKLQAEIDKTLKTVATGVETFEATFDKLNHANNSTQKDKLENDLKTQIKKLQRMRDQIKAWLGSSDIKDKSALMENRRLIETQMERFKALEKEMKMKAFSKEGLSAQSKLDPAEKAKSDMIDWVGTMTEELARQIEATEAELEGISTAKKKKGTGERVGELEELNERRGWHIGRLEIVQRMLDNGQLQSEEVESIQEDVKYFVESNADEEFDYDQGLYDDLNLLDEEDFGPGEFGLQQDEQSLDSASLVDPIDESPALTPAPKTPAKEETTKKPTPASKASKDATTSSVPDEQPPSPIMSKRIPSRKGTMDSTKQELPKLGHHHKAEIPPVPATVASTTPSKTTLPPIRYAAAAAAAVASAVTAPPMSSPLDIVSPTRSKLDLPAESPALEKESAPSPMPTATAAPTKLSIPQTNGATTSAPPPPPGLSSRSPNPGASTPQTSGFNLALPSEPPSVGAPPLLSPIAQTQPSAAAIAASGPPPPPPGYSAHAESSRTGAVGGFTAAPPQAPSQPPSQSQQQQGVLGSLMQSFDVAKEMSERRGNDISLLHQALEVSYRDAPLQGDSEPPRYYLPKNPVKTPSHYPQTRATVLSDREIYNRFDVDQLFFIFYYYSGSYEQCLAAQKLKEHNWRFHKQYLTWFKRAHNPQAITDEYEQGGYFYFDWENSWCQRKKSDFRFEYRWLSEN